MIVPGTSGHSERALVLEGWLGWSMLVTLVPFESDIIGAVKFHPLKPLLSLTVTRTSAISVSDLSIQTPYNSSTLHYRHSGIGGISKVLMTSTDS